MYGDTNADFPLTRWTLIDQLRNGQDQERDAALLTLVTAYWSPVYSYLRKKGKNRDESTDLTQEFFSAIILNRQLFDQAREEIGALRSLLLTALKRFLIDQNRYNRVQPLTRAIPVEDIRKFESVIAADTTDDPETVFQRRWAVALLEEALRRCECHFRETGKLAHWLAFELRIVKPSISMSDPPTHETISRQLKLKGAKESVGYVKVVRKRLLMILQQVVAETAESLSERDAEFQSVVELLS